MFLIGHSSEKIYGKNPDTIKIGLLIQDKSSVEAIYGAALAVESVNRQSDRLGIYFQIEARSMEGPWGTGAKETVDLVFNNASVLIVSADGRNSHLAEQVSAKTQVPMVSVQSSDPTLAQAFIPWFFNCVPDDNTQSQILLEVMHERKYKRPLVISDNSYDSKMQAVAVLKAAKKANYNITHFCKDDYPKIEGLSESMQNYNPDCIMLFMKPASAAGIISEINRSGMKPALFGSLLFSSETISEKLLTLLEGMTLISPGYLFVGEGEEFTRAYNKKYGITPCFSAACAFDAVNAITECFMSDPEGRSKLKEKLAQTGIEGMTGKFGFDSMGNRKGNIRLMTINGGHFVQN